MSAVVSLPLPTLKRLPRYLELLKDRSAKGEEWVSSESMSRCLGLTAIQVRKDLGLTGAPASPKRGFRIEETLSLIEEILGTNHLTGVFLIGAGARGGAACDDPSLASRGFKIAAIFDPSPEIREGTLCGFKVLPLAELPALAKRVGVRLAILTISESRFPGCARLAFEAGIQGLINLSGEALEAIEGLVILQDDLGFQLASLSRELEKNSKQKS
jgi:redox-sensing transcriptional repressor